ncbi:TVP38/TMEM64 family protein [Paenibacillus sonchi]|nr:TVP38/TMEM64 family protein [Paenibacillus sonchi]
MAPSRKILISRISLLILAGAAVILMLKYLPDILQLTVSFDEFRKYILSTGKAGPAVLILFQILQTVIAPIPGEVVQIAGGYIYGVTLGTIYVTAGMLTGSAIAFYFTRFMGGFLIGRLIEKKKLKWMTDMMERKNFSVFLFIFFLIPGLPKDFLVYIAGLTPMKPLRLFGILLAGRLPWLIASVAVGANIYQKNYTSTIILSVLAVVAFVLGLIYKDKLIHRFGAGKSAGRS